MAYAPTGYIPQPLGTNRFPCSDGQTYDIPNYFAPLQTNFAVKKTAFTNDIEQFAAEANDYARKILDKEPKLGQYHDTGSRFNPLSENCYIPFHKINIGLFFGGGGTRVNVYNGHGGSQRQDHTKELLVAGLALLFGGAFATGLTYRKHNEAAVKLESNKRTFEDITNWANTPDLRNHFPHTTSKLKAFADKYMHLLKRNYDNTWWNLAISISILAGGAFLALGAVLGANAMAIGGGVLAVAAITVLLIRLGMSWGDKSEKNAAIALRSAWKELKKPSEHHTNTSDRTQVEGKHAQTGVTYQIPVPKFAKPTLEDF